MIPGDCIDDQVIIGSGNVLVPSGTKPLPDSMLTKIHSDVWYHLGAVS